MTGSGRTPENDGNQWTTPASLAHGPDLANRQMRTARAAVILIFLILTGCGLPQTTVTDSAKHHRRTHGPGCPGAVAGCITNAHRVT